jgi:hypothetical protein
MTRRKHMEANSADDRSVHRLDVVPALGRSLSYMLRCREKLLL